MALTPIVVGLLVVLIAVYDVWIILKKGKQESISAYIIRWSKQYPSIPFLIGFVAGHLFWSMSDKDWMLESIK